MSSQPNRDLGILSLPDLLNQPAKKCTPFCAELGLCLRLASVAFFHVISVTSLLHLLCTLWLCKLLTGAASLGHPWLFVTRARLLSNGLSEKSELVLIFLLLSPIY